MERLRIFIMVMAGLLTTASVARGETLQATLTGYEEIPAGFHRRQRRLPRDHSGRW